MEKLKELQVGKTKIGSIEAELNGELCTFDILYGNVASPMINKQVLRLPRDKYYEMVENFLDSDDGLQYAVPTEKQMKEAIRKISELEKKWEAVETTLPNDLNDNSPEKSIEESKDQSPHKETISTLEKTEEKVDMPVDTNIQDIPSKTDEKENIIEKLDEDKPSAVLENTQEDDSPWIYVAEENATDNRQVVDIADIANNNETTSNVDFKKQKDNKKPNVDKKEQDKSNSLEIANNDDLSNKKEGDSEYTAKEQQIQDSNENSESNDVSINQDDNLNCPVLPDNQTAFISQEMMQIISQLALIEKGSQERLNEMQDTIKKQSKHLAFFKAVSLIALVLMCVAGGMLLFYYLY